MNVRTLFPAALLGFALLLTACEITFDGGTPPPEPDITLSAESTTAPTPHQITVEGTDSLLVEVTLGSEELDDEALYVELGTEVDVGLVLRTRGGSALASTTRADVFFRSTAGITSAASAGVAPQGVGVAELCLGACILNDASSSSYLVQVFNDSASDRTLDLYLYTKAYADEYEPANNTEAGAVALSSAESDSGAIEDIGDQDYWRIQETGDLFFDDDADRPSQLELSLILIAGDEEFGPYTPGSGPIPAVAGDIAIVYEDGANAAAVSGTSQYFLTLDTQ